MVFGCKYGGQVAFVLRFTQIFNKMSNIRSQAQKYFAKKSFRNCIIKTGLQVKIGQLLFKITPSCVNSLPQ